MRIRFFICFVLLSGFLIASGQNIKVLFRYDDFKLRNETFQDSLLAAFDHYNIPISLAVIPYTQAPVPQPYQSMDKERLDYLKKLIGKKVVEITLHGFNHRKIPLTEFKGVGVEEQYFRINTGKNYLDSVLNINISTFTPPYNSYDSITLGILEKLNFKGLSADIYGTSSSDKISYIPCTYQYIYGLKKMIDKNKDKDVVLVVMLHHYNFNGSTSDYPVTHTATFNELEDVLSWINAHGVKCYSYAQLIGSGEDFGRERYLVNSKPFDGVVSRRFEHFYVPVDYKWLKVVDKVAWVVYYLILLLVLRLVTRLFKIKLNRSMITILWVFCTCVLVAFCLYGRFTHKLLFIINGFGALWAFVSLLLIKRKNLNSGFN